MTRSAEVIGSTKDARHESRRDLAEVGRGAAASLTNTVIAAVSGLAVTVLLTRTLGASRYGAMAVALTVVTLIQAVTSAGIGNGAVRMIAFARAEGDRAKAMRMVRSGIVVGLVTGLAGTAIVLVLGLTGVMEGFGVSLALTILAPLVLATSLRAAFGAVIRAYRDLRAILFLGIAAPLVDILLIGGLVLAGADGIAVFAGALVASAFIDLLMSMALVRRRRQVGSITQSTVSDTKALVAFSLPLLASQLLFFAMRSADVLLLGTLRSTAEAGLYAPVMRLTEFATKGLAAFAVLFVPIATGYVARNDTGKLKDLYLSVTKWGYLIGVPVLIVLVAVPAQVLPFLFGEPYAAMERVAWVLAIGYWAILMTGLNGVTLGTLGLVGPMAWFAALGMAVNLALGFLLIPRFGPLGAAWSNTLSYSFVNCAYSLVLYRRTGITPFRRDTVGLFLYSGAIIAAATAVGRLPSFQALLPAIGLSAAAVVVWFAGALTARPFHMEVRELRRLAADRRAARRERDANEAAAPDTKVEPALPLGPIGDQEPEV
ncbi:MAG: flippase [Actinobacteria bacterium]|nr:flippase [Actinomycetota bacterium]